MKSNFKFSKTVRIAQKSTDCKMIKSRIFAMLLLVPIFLSAQNLLINPSFEDDFAYWSAGPSGEYYAPSVVTNDAQDGDSKSVKYDAVSATTGFFQNIPVTAGQTYEINFWYKASGDDSDARLWSIFRDSSGEAIYTTNDATTDSFRTNNGFLPTSSEWKFYTAEMPAGIGVVSLDVAVRTYTGGTACFDNFKAGIAGSMTVVNINAFKNAVKMNTVVSDKLTFKLPERATVSIFSMEGKLISSNRVDDGDSINTQYLHEGIYFVKVSNGYTTVTQKIIKK